MADRGQVNRQVLLVARPAGIPDSEHFKVVEGPLPVPGDGQVLVRNLYLSVEPAMRGWVSAVANYSEPVAIGAVMRALAAGRVEASRHADYRPRRRPGTTSHAETGSSGRPRWWLPRCRW